MILNHERVDNNCLDKFGMDRHPIIHCSGHARSPADLFRIVSEIDAASVLFPVHTERPEMCTSGRQKKMAAVVEEGKTYTRSNNSSQRPPSLDALRQSMG
jgi:mRNA degradation ribonuclease J1/J2